MSCDRFNLDQIASTRIDNNLHCLSTITMLFNYFSVIFHDKIPEKLDLKINFYLDSIKSSADVLADDKIIIALTLSPTSKNKAGISKQIGRREPTSSLN